MTDSSVHEQGLRLSVLQHEQVQRIHALSLDILEHTGIILHYPRALTLLHGHGALTDPSRPIVRIPHALVEQALRTAPRLVTLHSAAAPQKDCALGVAGGIYTRPASGLNWIVDAKSALRRAVTEADAVHWTHLAHALPNIHLVAAAYDQVGAPQSMEVRSVWRMLQHTDKPLMVSGVSGEGMRWIKRMIDVAQPPERQPRAMVLSSVNSPLVYSRGQLEVALVAAELGIPVLCNSSAVSGVTAPVTLAGALVQMNAEMLAALTIIQLHHPGAPVVYAGHPVIMDMRTGISAFGMAEIGLLAGGCIDLGRFYGLPTASDGLTTDSCTPDPLAASEKWASGYLPMMAGANINGGAGALASQSTISLEQMVIDDEIYGSILRQTRGLAVDDEMLAGDLVTHVGPGGSFLAEEHTLRHYRAEVRYAALASRLSAPSWEAAGSRDALQRAEEMVHGILSTRAEPMLGDDQVRALTTLLTQAEKTMARY